MEILSGTCSIESLISRAQPFAAELEAVKQRLTGVDWYPYATLSCLAHIDRLLTGVNRDLPGDTRLGKILDLGCGDGDLAFFLASLGYEVDAVDHPTYSHNGMQGVRALKRALSSPVQIHEVDLDRQFSLPDGHYALVFALGVLYHLRNPFYVMEELAKQSTACIVSTRVATRYPGGKTIPPAMPAAYLLDDRELNDDDSNYFIFSQPALRVLLKRTHWEVADWTAVGDRVRSDPVSQRHDERVFALLKSRYGSLGEVELLDGWHEAEGDGWRWTTRNFSIRARIGKARRCVLAMELFLAKELLSQTAPILLSISVDGAMLPPAQFESAGPYTLTREFRSGADGAALIEFGLNCAIAPDALDRRTRALIVKSVHTQ